MLLPTTLTHAVGVVLFWPAEMPRQFQVSQGYKARPRLTGIHFEMTNGGS